MENVCYSVEPQECFADEEFAVAVSRQLNRYTSTDFRMAVSQQQPPERERLLAQLIVMHDMNVEVLESQGVASKYQARVALLGTLRDRITTLNQQLKLHRHDATIEVLISAESTWHDYRDELTQQTEIGRETLLVVFLREPQGFVDMIGKTL